MLLTYEPLIPETSTSKKDFSLLEETVRTFSCYQKENEKSCSFLRGSMVSSYKEQIVKEHSHSDFDIEIITPKQHRRVNQHQESIEEFEEPISVDITYLNQKKLEKEIMEKGNHRLTTTNDLVMDFLPLENKSLAQRFREGALTIFLRYGLSLEEEPYYEITPSGAMKAINEARLAINPLRWWSIYYSFKESSTAPQNLLTYYEDVERALYNDSYLTYQGKRDGESLYTLPENYAIKKNGLKIKTEYYTEKMLGRINSSPIVSLNDFQKIHLKGKSLFFYLLNKPSMETLIPYTERN